MSIEKSVEFHEPSGIRKEFSSPEGASLIVAFSDSDTLAPSSSPSDESESLAVVQRNLAELAVDEHLRRKAEGLLLALPRHTGLMLGAYPMSRGEIVLSASSRAVKGTVLLTLAPEGEAWCNVRINGRSRRAWYPDTRDWPDGFVVEALAELVGARMRSFFWTSGEWWERPSDHQTAVQPPEESNRALPSGSFPE